MDSAISLYLACATRALLTWAQGSYVVPSPLDARDQIEELCLPFRELAGAYFRDELWQVFIEKVALPHAEAVLGD
jgi:hypothetical protein